MVQDFAGYGITIGKNSVYLKLSFFGACVPFSQDWFNIQRASQLRTSYRKLEKCMDCRILMIKSVITKNLINLFGGKTLVAS